jgi:regulator of telomere elongation helicase 1
MRAVNQALGRVIRHRNDYGAVLLCDERFGQEGTRQQLSKWLRDKVAQPPTFGAAAAHLQKFFRVR